MRLKRFLAVAAAALLLAPAIAVAQSSIAGSVTDDTGGVLPGVTVEASSDVLIEGSRVVFTDGTGSYNIIDLRPGEYTVLFTLPGFGTLVRDELILGADVALPIDAVLSVGSVEETITVSGETPVVDVQQVQRIEVMTRETQEAIPTGRSTWSYALLIPGVKARAPDMGGTAGAQQSEMMGRGLDAAHTTVEIDGMMINTLISDGRYQAYMNPMMAAETSYTTSGATAETQNGGLRINMIPNEGGNQYSGNFFAGGTPGAWQANNLNDRLQDLGVQETPKVSIIYDFNGSMGGPVFRDKLWFFSSARRNVIDDGVLNSTNRDGSPALDRNSITSANARLTWQMNPQHKISAMFDKVRKRRFSEHGPGDDIETAAQSWTSPHYDTGTAKWTGTLSNRMLAEFGFSLVYEDWDPGYYRFSSLGDYEYFSQTKPSDGELATCFSTPCYDAPGSAAYMAQTAPGANWYNVIPKIDDHLGMTYGVSDEHEQNNYSHRWAYQSAVSYVTGSHSFKVGMNFSHGQNRHTRTGNGDLIQEYDDSPNTYGRTLDFVNSGHFAAEANNALGLPSGTIGAAEWAVVHNFPENRAYNLDYNGGIYAQDSWTVDRLTLNYGLRVDWAAVSIPDTPKGLGRFTPSDVRPGRARNELPSYGPDFSPRFSMAYDVFGDARTALKFSYNKYVRDVGTGLPSRYQYGGARTDRRVWNDCVLDPVSAAAGDAVCAAPGSDYALMYGASQNDNLAQNWEIGPQRSAAFGSFGIPSANPNLDDFAREYNHIWTAGVQQEIFPGLSLSAEYRRRYFRNTFSRDNRDVSFGDFGALADGSPDPAYAGTGRYLEVARPYPMTGSFTLFNLDPALRGVDDNVWEQTMVDGYSNIYHGFELSAQGRLAGGGTLFGGWSMEDTGRTTIYGFDSTAGGGSYGGETSLCSDVLARGDNPNELRFCNQKDYPRPFRHEFKLSGTQPFSLPGLGDLQFGASLQAYPGGGNIRWGAFQEGLNVRRYAADDDPNELLGTYSERLFGQPGHCVAPCALGERFVPGDVPTVSTSDSGYWVPMVPLASVKFLPYWTQLDMNFLKVFNVGSWRYEARWEFFNMLNNGVELENTFNHSGSTGAGYQSLSGWERAVRLLPGRVIRFAVTARF